MSLRDRIAALPQGGQFTAVMDKLKDADPAAIRRVAARWVMAGHDTVGNMNVLAGAVRRVDDWWKGEASDGFVTYMARYGRAGRTLSDLLVSAASSLNDVADELSRARKDVDRIAGDLLDDVDAIRAAYDRAGNDPEATAANRERAIGGRVSAAAQSARERLEAAESALSTALKNVNKQLGIDQGLFSGIPAAGDQEFTADKVGWVPVSPEEFRRTTLAASDGPGGGPAGANGGAYGGGGGTGDHGYTGTSSGGATPRPKAEVVEWIKQALTVIKSPEMADILRRRGLDVSDLDPDDPRDIERIWTVIHHESGGNPSAINRWDVNAQNGVPSQGLMQTIPPTFDAHSLPGYKRILEPVDNIIAGVLYTYSRYGDLAHHPGIASLERGGGYRPY